MTQIFLAWHTHAELDDKLLGVFSTRENAEAQIERSRPLPGFRDEPDGFEISEHVLDRPEWTDGYVTMVHGDVD